MTIKVNYSGTRINLPTIHVQGRIINSEGGIGVNKSTSLTNDIEEDETTSGNWVNQPVTTFWGNVTITIGADKKYAANDYSRRSSGDIIGPPEVDQASLFVGQTPTGGGLGSDTYYTINGKNPKRTKSNLYTGPFLVRRNESGSDNYSLKART